MGLAAWTLDKWREWSDCGGDPLRRFTRDQLLTTVMLYWATGTIGSSFRIYRDWALGMADRPETWRLPGRGWVPAGVQPRPLPAGEQLQVPVAVALFRERWPREWAERVYRDLRPIPAGGRAGHPAPAVAPDPGPGGGPGGLEARGRGPRAHRRRARGRAPDLGRDVDPDPGGPGAAITAVGVALEIVDLARPPDDPVSVVAANVFHRAGRLRPVPAGTPVGRR